MRRGRLRSLSLLCIAFFLVVPATGAASFSWKVSEKILANGLKVLLLEDPRSPTVTFQVWYRVGSRNERLGQTGASHLLEHLMFRGTEKFGPGEFSRLVQERGGTHNAFTSQDYTAYFETIGAVHLPLLVTLEADRMRNMDLTAQSFLAERKIVMEERRLRTADNPTADLWEQVQAAAFTSHPYMWPIIGWMADLQALTLNDVAQYYRTYYAPNNAILVAVGDFQSSTLLAHIEKDFGDIPPAPPPPRVTAIEPLQRGEKRLILKRPAALPVVVAAYHTPNLWAGESFTLTLLATILGGGRSSRLEQSLVKDQALALAVNAAYDLLTHDPDLMTFSIHVAPRKKWQDAEKALYRELDKLKTELVSERELAKAKNLVESAFVYGQDSLFYRAMLLAEYTTIADWFDVKKFIPGIRAVTAEDIQKAARTYLHPDNRIVGILLPSRTD